MIVAGPWGSCARISPNILCSIFQASSHCDPAAQWQAAKAAKRKVMLDPDLAGLYGVETKTLNRTVKRHVARFPDDFLLHLTRKEVANLRFQIGTSSLSYGGRRYRPYAFTEQGVAMLRKRIFSWNLRILPIPSRWFIFQNKLVMPANRLVIPVIQ